MAKSFVNTIFASNFLIAIIAIGLVWVIVNTETTEGVDDVSVVGTPISANQRTLIDCSWRIANPLLADAEIYNEDCKVVRNSPTCSQRQLGFLLGLKAIGIGATIDYLVEWDLEGKTTMRVDGNPTTEISFKIGENFRIADWINSDWDDINQNPTFNSKVCAKDKPSYEVQFIAIDKDGTYIHQVDRVFS